MGLRQSIVIKNEFTYGEGTRGSTPGNYVVQYMARGGASEILTPVRSNDHQNYIMNYMLRDEAVEKVESVDDLKEDFRQMTGYGGKAFGYGSVSLSDESLKSAAADIQRQFDRGKTIMKVVLSFEEDYLKQNGIIDKDFHCIAPGDYRGNVDQLKLRSAIMSGLKRTARHFDDLQYIGVIQVDTEHVHCHLAMYDRGVGTLVYDGSQKGKLTDMQMYDIRRGIDMYLDEKQAVKTMVSNVQYDKQNTIGYIKRFTHSTMEHRGAAQFMLACLPEDRTLWRAKSNAKVMQKPNMLVREYVTDVLSQPESGYDDALNSIETYAHTRQQKEGFSDDYKQKLVNDGKNRIITRGMDAVYAILKQIPDESVDTNTPLLDVMSLPFDNARDLYTQTTETSDSLIEFGFRLRTYKTRLDHHASEYAKYHEARTKYEDEIKNRAQQNTTLPSQPYLDFLEIEEEYNEKLMTKYQYFLDFVPPEGEYEAELMELDAFSRQIMANQHMADDTDLRRMNPENAEKYGMTVYGVAGGAMASDDINTFNHRLDSMKDTYSSMREKFEVKMQTKGFTLTEYDTLIRMKRYDFEDVKSLDLHHIQYDFPYEFEIPLSVINDFTEMADRRYNAFVKAKSYLEGSGQEIALDSLPVQDIESQHAFAMKFTGKHTVISEQMPEYHMPGKTIRLDYEFYSDRESDIQQDIQNIVQNTISSLQYE